MEDIEIFLDENDHKANELLVKYNRVVWFGINNDQTTIISYSDISKIKRKLVSLILGIIWSKPNVE